MYFFSLSLSLSFISICCWAKWHCTHIHWINRVVPRANKNFDQLFMIWLNGELFIENSYFFFDRLSLFNFKTFFFILCSRNCLSTTPTNIYEDHMRFMGQESDTHKNKFVPLNAFEHKVNKLLWNILLNMYDYSWLHAPFQFLSAAFNNNFISYLFFLTTETQNTEKCRSSGSLCGSN